jgi:ACS family pantothenate transporter-like MFS transporter
MLLYLKYRKDMDGFSQSQVNTLPIATHAIGIVAELSSSLAIDRYNQRLTIGFTLCAIQIICSIVLLVPNMSVPGNLTVLYLSSTSYGINPLLYSWSSNIVARTADDAARSVILASMAASDGLLWTFWGIVLYPADDAPYWRKGYIAMICISTALASWLFVVRWVCKIFPPSGRQQANSSQLDGYTARKYSGDCSDSSDPVVIQVDSPTK